MNSWDDVKQNMGNWFQGAAQGTDRLARLGMRAYDRHGIARDLERDYARLGRVVHRLMSEDENAVLRADATVRAEMGRIARHREELHQAEQEMDELRRAKSKAADAEESAGEAAPEEAATEPTQASTENSGAERPD
jgi:hypothetical protein